MRGALKMPSPDRPPSSDPLNTDTELDLAAVDLFPFNKLYSRITELRELLLFQLKSIDRAEQDLADLELYRKTLIENSEERLPQALEQYAQEIALLEQALEAPEQSNNIISPDLDYEAVFAEIQRLESEQASIKEELEAARAELGKVTEEIQNMPNTEAAERYRRQIIQHTAVDLFSAFECFVRDLLIEDVLLSDGFLVYGKIDNGKEKIKRDLYRKQIDSRQKKFAKEKMRGATCFFLNSCHANFQSPNTASELYVDYFEFKIIRTAKIEYKHAAPSEATLPWLRREMQLLTSMRHSIIHSEGSKRHPEYRYAFKACQHQLPEKLLESDDIPDPILVLATALSDDRPESLKVILFHDVVLRFCWTLLVKLSDEKDELLQWVDSLRKDEPVRKHKRMSEERTKFFRRMGMDWKPPQTMKP